MTPAQTIGVPNRPFSVAQSGISCLKVQLAPLAQCWLVKTPRSGYENKRLKALSSFFLNNEIYMTLYVSYRVFNCILVHFIPLPVFIFYSFTGIYILLILFLYSILSTLFPCTLYGLIFPFLFLYFNSIFVYSFSLFSVPAWMGLYRRGWDYTAWSVFV